MERSWSFDVVYVFKIPESIFANHQGSPVVDLITSLHSYDKKARSGLKVEGSGSEYRITLVRANAWERSALIKVLEYKFLTRNGLFMESVLSEASVPFEKKRISLEKGLEKLSLSNLISRVRT